MRNCSAQIQISESAHFKMVPKMYVKGRTVGTHLVSFCESSATILLSKGTFFYFNVKTFFYIFANVL